MSDKRFWSGAIAIVTLLVGGASVLPALLLPSASTGSAVVLPLGAPKAEAIVKSEPTPAVVRRAPVSVDNGADPAATPVRSAVEAAPEPVAIAPEPPKEEPDVTAAPAPAPSGAFPPVQAVGVAAPSAPDVVPPSTPPVTPVNAAPPIADKPAKSERATQRAARPRQNVRPAAYPIGEFLAFRR